jgi:D-aminoacyl-tRNA deacylase
MRIVLQRVTKASVTVGATITGQIAKGLVALVAIGQDDDDELCQTMADKVCQLRIFPDENDLMNRSLADVKGGLLAISQFTLYADCRKGRRPFFGGGADGPRASALFDEFVARVRANGLACPCGVFGAHMMVALENDGPVTIWLDSDELARPRKTSLRKIAPESQD